MSEQATSDVPLGLKDYAQLVIALNDWVTLLFKSVRMVDLPDDVTRELLAQEGKVARFRPFLESDRSSFLFSQLRLGRMVYCAKNKRHFIQDSSVSEAIVGLLINAVDNWELDGQDFDFWLLELSRRIPLSAPSLSLGIMLLGYLLEEELCAGEAFLGISR